MVPFKIVKGHCPRCGADRNAEVVAEFSNYGEDETRSNWSRLIFQIIRCAGCGEIYYRKDETHNGDTNERKITYWPAPTKRDLPPWTLEIWAIDGQLDELMTETYTALNNDARILAAIGVRTMLDHVSETLGVDPALSFFEKLRELQTLGKIGADEKDTLSVLTNAGGAAAHRGWKPSVGQLNTLVTIAENFIYRTVILHRDAKELRNEIPQKPKRK